MEDVFKKHPVSNPLHMTLGFPQDVAPAQGVATVVEQARVPELARILQRPNLPSVRTCTCVYVRVRACTYVYVRVRTCTCVYVRLEDGQTSSNSCLTCDAQFNLVV